MAEFNIKDLYQFTFGGTIAPPFPIVKPELLGKTVAKSFEETTLNPNTKNRKPVTGDFNFKTPLGGEYKMPVKMGLTPKISDQYQLPNEPIISISGRKDVKLTTIRRPKGRGTVKEERSLGDYTIKIQGLCINTEADDYPEDQVTSIRNLYEAKGVVYITNLFTRIFNIQKVSMLKPEFPRNANLSIRVQPYVLTCVSDFDFDDFKAILSEENN